MEKTLSRGAGILLPISSLPQNYGIGTMGKSAFEFISKLNRAKIKYWQVLPVGPTSYGDSPYQSFSAFAGNPYFIDLDTLCEEGLLEKSYLESIKWSYCDHEVSYELLWDNRFKVLKQAFQNSNHKETEEYKAFLESQAHWLQEYALFMACKGHFDNKSWLEWDDDIKFRQHRAIEHYRNELSEEVEFYEFLQFKFFEQWTKMKAFANENGIKIIGDIPIYVALDSADIWANPTLFQLDEFLQPKYVAGCPPDMFSSYGQKWGNPLYDWDVMEQTDFTWWKCRMQFSAKIYDVIRIDHFIGIVRYFSIPTELEPKDGFYREGPSTKLIEAIDSSVGESKIIAEDLGVVTDDVKALLLKSGYPGMKVLEFAFDSGNSNMYLPHNHIKNSVVYVGTHDNDTFEGYIDSISDGVRAYLMSYLNCEESRLTDEIIRSTFGSVADTIVVQMQDILKKDTTARMNYPSTLGSNWKWRLTDGEFAENEINRLATLCDIYAR